MTETDNKARLHLAIGVFRESNKATALVEKLIADDFPPDRISLLHRSGGSGDDMLGISYASDNERIKVWGEHGAFWGAIWGLLAGATGMFVLPGVGALLAAGPIVEAIAGAVAGGVLTGSAMAGAAALTGLASALHRMGIPSDALHGIENAVGEGAYVVLLHCDAEEVEQCLIKIRWAGADESYDFPVTI